MALNMAPTIGMALIIDNPTFQGKDIVDLLCNHQNDHIMVVQIIYDIFIFTYYIMANFIHLNVVV